MAANVIEQVNESNPYGIIDICSHLIVNQDSRLIISDWMPYISNYTVQFWIKSKYRRVIKFSCSATYVIMETSSNWQAFQKTFTAKDIDSIKIDLSAGEYWIYNFKAEKGVTPTDWSPHPDDIAEDVVDGIEGLSKRIIEYAGSISDVESKVDKVELSIENKIWKTDFMTEIDGVYKSMDEINTGFNKWYLSVFNKEDFVDIDENDDIDDREKYDISIFSLDNADVVPESEFMINDKSGDMLTAVVADDKILYFLAYAKFSEATAFTTVLTHGKATLYVNGLQVYSSDKLGTDNVILNFASGWNLIEIISNSNAVCFGNNISEHEKCEQFNCAIAVPTSRTVKVRKQYSYLTQHIDNINMVVGEQISELGTTIETNYNQTKDMFSWVITDGSDEDSITFTPQALTAMTDQFIVVDPDDNTKVVISNGEVNANRITSTMLNTDAITSSNFDIEEYENDDIPRYSSSGTKLDLLDGTIYSKNFFIDGTSGNAYFCGDIISNSATLGPWTLNSTSLFKGNGTLGSDSSLGNIYLGDDGFSLCDKLVYNSNTGDLSINVNHLDVAGNNWTDAVIDAIGKTSTGNLIYRAQGVPTSSTYPTTGWTTDEELAKHIGDLYYDDSTGKAYQFRRSTSTQIQIKFTSTSDSRAGYDQVRIYYYVGKQLYVTNGYSGATGTYKLQGATITIPTDRFYLRWTTNETNLNYYGFEIESVTIPLTTETNSNASTGSFPSEISHITLPIGEYPELIKRSPYEGGQDKLWYISPVLAGSTYEWAEIPNDGIDMATYIHYDAVNGLVLHNGSFDTTGGASYTPVSTVTDGNVRIKSDGVHMYAANKEYASYGSTTYFYGYKNNGTQFIGAQINADGFLIGSTNSQYLKWDGSDLTMKVNSLYIGSTDVSSALSNAANGAKTATNYLVYDGTNGLRIYADTSSQSNAYNVQIKGDGMYIRKGDTKLAEYGKTTYFYSDGSTVAAQLDGDGLYIKKGSISIGTNFSVDTSGKLRCSNSTLFGVFESNNAEGKTIISDAYIRGYKPDNTMTGFLDLQANYTDGRRACVLGANTWELKLQGHTGISFERYDDRVVWMYLDGAALYLYENIDMRNHNIVNQSDARKKKNIKLVNFNACEMIKKIPVKEFQWKEDNKSIYAGFIAQDVERLETDFLNAGYETIVQEDALGFKAICYNKLIPILWKANQELNEEISSLKQEIQLLKQSNNVNSYLVD